LSAPSYTVYGNLCNIGKGCGTAMAHKSLCGTGGRWTAESIGGGRVLGSTLCSRASRTSCAGAHPHVWSFRMVPKAVDIY
jgi:hypothetical protein